MGRQQQAKSLLPAAVEVEATVLGSMMISSSAAKEMADMLTVDAFYASHHRKIWRAITDLLESGAEADIVTVSERLRGTQELKDVGDVVALSELCDNVATTMNVAEYAPILLDRQIRRETVTHCTKAIERVTDVDSDLGEAVTTLETAGVVLGDKCDTAKIARRKRGKILRVGDIAGQVIEYHGSGFRNVGLGASCWPTFSELYRPAKGTLNIVSGQPGSGKSEFLDALMVNLSEQHGMKWAVFSPENYPWELYAQKLVEKRTGQPFRSLDTVELGEAMEWLDQHFFLLDSGEDSVTLDSLLMLCRQAVEIHKIDGAIFDPWNEIEMAFKSAGENETQYITRTLGQIRRFARHHNLIQFIVAHPAKLKRDQRTGKYPVPTMYDIAGSAAFFNKADNGFSVVRDYDNHQIDVHIQKIKFKVHGKVGVQKFQYLKESGRFQEVNDDTQSVPPRKQQQTARVGWGSHHIPPEVSGREPQW